VLLGHVDSLLIVKLFIRGENVSGLHCSSFLWTEHTLDHQSSLELVGSTVVADPVRFWNNFKSKARLVHRHAADKAEDNLIIIFKVADATYGAKSIFLGNL
jgi:hypothetical protein